MAELTRAMAEFVARARFGDLPEPVIAECKRLLLDTIGCAFGAVGTQSGRIALDYVKLQGGAPKATVIGNTMRSSALMAAYANARLANVLDADDTFPTSTHFGNATVFSALALAELLGRDGRDLITAIAVGFDLGARIGSWMGAPMQIENGQVVGWNELGGPAATVTWAAIGASAKTAALDAGKTVHAFGIGGANSPQPTLRKWAASERQPMYKYADAGWCAEIGVSAALLARLGSTGFTNILDGDAAFWKMYGSPSHDDAALLDGLGSKWQILNTTYKPWPCCRWIHHPLTALSGILAEHRLIAEEMERVVVRANPFALTPIFREQQPEDMLSAEFSHAHAIAMVVHGIPPGPQWYDAKTMNDPRIIAFRAKVEVEPEPSSANIADWMTGGQWRGVPGGVDVHARGALFRATADNSLGDPWGGVTRFTDADIRAKFNVMIGLSAQGEGPDDVRVAAEEIVEAIGNLEHVGALDTLLRAMGVLSAASGSRLAA